MAVETSRRSFLLGFGATLVAASATARALEAVDPVLNPIVSDSCIMNFSINQRASYFWRAMDFIDAPFDPVEQSWLTEMCACPTNWMAENEVQDRAVNYRIMRRKDRSIAIEGDGYEALFVRRKDKSLYLIINGEKFDVIDATPQDSFNDFSESHGFGRYVENRELI